ncbi:GHKL domain-containing protein [Gordonia sp. GONU]|nr:GHKL domain-containing protein [Gordonia sp. GONU]
MARQQSDVDLAALIRHELSPAVGWIRLAADEEITSFADSKTNDAVKKLQRRIDGLVALIKSNEDLNLRRVHISGLLFDNWPDTLTAPAIEPADGCKDIEIETDEGLFGLLLSNVFQNAIDASFSVSESPQVQIRWGHTERDYWIRVTNPFGGNTFHLDDVLSVGNSSKRAHQGQGLALVDDIAATLGLTISLEGVGGIASFSITGERPHD